MISVKLPELAEGVRVKMVKYARKSWGGGGNAAAPDAHLAIEDVEVLITKVFRELVYVVFFIKCNECFRNVRIGHVALAERVTEVARVEVHDLLDDALTIPILKLWCCFEKI